MPERPLPPPRLGRGALLAFGAMIAAGSPGCTTTPSPNDTGVDAYYGGGGDAYGAPPHDAYGSIGDVYGAPDVGFLEDTGSTPDAGPADDAGTGGDGG